MHTKTKTCYTVHMDLLRDLFEPAGVVASSESFEEEEGSAAAEARLDWL